MKITKLKRSDLNKKYQLTSSMWQRRHDDVLAWLEDFMDIKEEKNSDTGYYYYYITGEVPESIPKLPRKNNTPQKIKDYKEYTIKSLTPEFTPNSKSKVAREAIEDFGYEKYNHTSIQAVSKRYVGPVMDEYGEHTDTMIWVNYNTYKPLTQEQEIYLHDCFSKVHLNELEMANAFKRLAQEEDISEDLDNFNIAIQLFKTKYAFRPISIYNWKAKEM